MTQSPLPPAPSGADAPRPLSNRTPYLDRIVYPADLRRLEESELGAVADELRQELIDAVSVTGGHLGAGLGVVELTVALHYVFETPKDKLIWDVGHQAYPHKILTGRRDRIRTLRQGGGLSGFTRRAESEYDPFGAAHSSTSISSALGMAVARDLKGESQNVIAVIGDGAMSAGMAYEAMNNAGSMDERLIVILNDNDMSIAPPVGAMSAYLSRLLSSKPYRSFRHLAREMASKFPGPLERAAKRAEEYARGFVTGGTLFEELGFYYVGPIDGHNLDHLLPVLKNVRSSTEKGPVLIHVVTQKGHGYAPAEAAADKYHGVVKFDVATGTQAKGKPSAPSYTGVYAKALIDEASRDDRVIAITAAMPSGTGLDNDRGLADAARTREEKGVGDPLLRDGVPQGRRDVRLTHHVLEPLRPPLSGQDLIRHGFSTGRCLRSLLDRCGRPLEVVARHPRGTEKKSVPLLPSGPDGVRDAPLRGT